MLRKKYCLLATHGDGAIDARVLQPFPPDDDFTVWLGTSPASRKARQVSRDPGATLVYQDDARSACVVLVGAVTLVDDLAERRRRFVPLWRAFWPDGPEGPDFVLLRFVPSRIEVWDARRRITPIPFGLRSACAVRGEDGAWREGPSETREPTR
jgi:general stress protein 26